MLHFIILPDAPFYKFLRIGIELKITISTELRIEILYEYYRAHVRIRAQLVRLIVFLI